MANNEEARTPAQHGKDSGYRVRQVTNYQPSWKANEEGQPGEFYVQLVLDNGVDAYVLQPEVKDTDVLLKLLSNGGHVSFDLDRKVLIFPNSSVK